MNEHSRLTGVMQPIKMSIAKLCLKYWRHTLKGRAGNIGDFDGMMCGKNKVAAFIGATSDMVVLALERETRK